MSRVLASIGLGLAILASPFASLQVAAATPPGSITWTVDHLNKTITAAVQIQIYSGCGGNPFGDDKDRASACQVRSSMTAAATQFMADKIKNQIERIWNKPYKYKCYTLKFTIDVKLAPDKSHVDPDRIAVRIDPSPGAIRDFVETDNFDPTKWRSDDPADRSDPTNSGSLETTWGEGSARGWMNVFAHEFGHLLGLHDAYHDVVNQQTGQTESVPYPDAPRDLMSIQIATISQETINRLVKRNLPNMKDTTGKPVTDADFKCDYRGQWSGNRIVGSIRYCGSTEHPYWGAEITANNGDRGYISYLIPEGKTSAPSELTTPFVEKYFNNLVVGTGEFIAPDDPANSAHFVVTNAEGTWIVTLENGSFCTPPP